MSDTYQLTVTFVTENETAGYTFTKDGIDVPCKVKFHDKVNVAFDGPGTVDQAVLISGVLIKEPCKSSPFTQGNCIDLNTYPTLDVGTERGLWGFTVSFAASVDDVTSFHYLPDPEMQVESRSEGDE